MVAMDAQHKILWLGIFLRSLEIGSPAISMILERIDVV
jgi:hypothetical protein